MGGYSMTFITITRLSISIHFFLEMLNVFFVWVGMNETMEVPPALGLVPCSPHPSYIMISQPSLALLLSLFSRNRGRSTQHLAPCLKTADDHPTYEKRVLPRFYSQVPP
jgi:hypothetical protein